MPWFDAITRYEVPIFPHFFLSLIFFFMPQYADSEKKQLLFGTKTRQIQLSTKKL